MTLTIVTINYNGAEDTLRLLKTLEQQTDRRFDVMVVDNDSEAADRIRLGAFAASSPLALDIIHSHRNTGFSGGNNIAIRKALAQDADWVLLLNNDATVDPGFVARFMAALPSEPSIVGLAVDEGAQVIPYGTVRWCTAHMPHHTVPRPRTRRYAIGAAMAVHRDVFHRIGLLDERYFLYFEDAEYSLRATEAGIPLRFIGPLGIRHHPSSSTRALGSPLLLRYHMRNAIRFNAAYAPWYFRALFPFWIFSVTCTQLVKLALGRNRQQSRAILLGIIDGICGRDGEIRTRPVIAVECESLEDASWGVARQVRGLLNALVVLPEVRSTYDVVAYFKSRAPDGEPWLEHPHVRTVVVHPLPWLPASFSLYYFIFFPLRILMDRPAVTYLANYMLPLIFVGKSIVMMTEDVWYEMRGRSLPFRYRLAYRIFATWAARRSTRIMAISHASGARVAQLFGIPKHRIFVNELAVDRHPQTPPKAGDYILYVAQALPRRHLRETIGAFRSCARRHPNLSLIAVGPDKYQPPVIRTLVDDTNHALGRPAVHWQERVTDAELSSLYAGAKVLVYVSDVEAFGLPPLEALTYGVPSVLLDAPVHREIFGELAFYTRTATVADISAALESSLTDTTKTRTIREEARSIIQRYTWEAHARRMVSVIRSIT